MKKWMKWTLALVLVGALVSCACAFGEEAEEEESQRRLRLGSSEYTVMLGEGFTAGDLTVEQIAAGQIDCYRDAENGLDFDVYQYPKDGQAQGIDHFALQRADAEDNVEVVLPSDSVNDIGIALYWAVRTVDGEEREVAAYFLDGGDSYVELLFTCENEGMSENVWDVVDTLARMELKTIRLGDSSFTLIVPDDYREGEISEADIADDQVAYWYSDASLLDFDVYQFSKDGQSQTLAEYVVEESSTYPVVTELVTDGEISGIPAAWYRTVDECDEGEYDTITYIIDTGDGYIDIVFWLDGPTAEAEADFIIRSLTDESAAD